MPCFGDREKGEVAMEERWDYINLDDFNSPSCGTVVSYIFLYLFLLFSVAVYAVDSFTAVNLLVFSRWASSIKPAIPFKISRWIFAVCILISFALLIVRWVRAIRAMRSGSISQSYLDPLAIRIESIRMGKRGRGFRRFLVFAELTKSKRGAEYVALFAYFSFHPWLNVCFADGPRQVVNAFTLYSVMSADLLPGGKGATAEASSPVLQFFKNLEILARQNDRQTLILLGMLFTLVIWVLSIIRLAVSIILYLIFLFHHIPSEDGSLHAYCHRKINTRLKRIVRQKVTKALKNGVALQDRKATNAASHPIDRKPTLPVFESEGSDKLSDASLSRSTTQTTLPPYSRPGTAAPDYKSSQPTLPDVDFGDRNPPLMRSATQSSAYSEALSLTGNAAEMGYSPLDRREPHPIPPIPRFPNSAPQSVERFNSPMSGPPRTQPHFEQGTLPMDARGHVGPRQAYFEADVEDYRNGSDEFDPYEEYSALSDRVPAQDASYRQLTPSVDAPERSLTPGSLNTMPLRNHLNLSSSPQSQNGSMRQPFPTTGESNDFPERSFTPAAQNMISRPLATPNAGYPSRSFSPTTQSPTPRPQADVRTTDSERGARPFSPSNSTTSRHPMAGTKSLAQSGPTRSFTPGTDGIGEEQPHRTFTPVNRNGTPWQRDGGNPNQGYAPRSYTPVAPSSTPRAQQSNGYVALNPSMASGTPAPRIQFPNTSNYRSFSRPGPPPTPFAQGRRPSPAQSLSNRGGTPQPEKYTR